MEADGPFHYQLPSSNPVFTLGTATSIHYFRFLHPRYYGGHGIFEGTRNPSLVGSNFRTNPSASQK